MESTVRGGFDGECVLKADAVAVAILRGGQVDREIVEKRMVRMDGIFDH